MAQGNHKLGKAKRSVGSQKRKTVKSVKKKRKGSTKVENNRSLVATTKAINSKNERIVAAKACNAGTQFFLKDISDKGEIFDATTTILRFSDWFGYQTTYPNPKSNILFSVSGSPKVHSSSLMVPYRKERVEETSVNKKQEGR